MKKIKKILFFQSAVCFYETMGIYPLQPDANRVFNLKIAFTLFSLTSACISTTAFFLFEAQSITEYIETFYAAITTLSCVGCLLVNRYKVENLFLLKQNVEELIEKSECLHFVWKLKWVCIIIMPQGMTFLFSSLWVLFKYSHINKEPAVKFFHFDFLFFNVAWGNNKIACLKFVHQQNNTYQIDNWHELRVIASTRNQSLGAFVSQW